MKYELMGHRMDSNKAFCEDCGQPKGRIVAMGLACSREIETEDDHEAEEKFEMENEN
jgi:hypothetical protein